MSEQPDMHCEQAEVLIAELIYDDFIDEKNREPLKQHIAQCDSCKQLHGDMKITAGLLKTGLESEPQLKLSPDKKKALLDLCSDTAETDSPASESKQEGKDDKTKSGNVIAWPFSRFLAAAAVFSIIVGIYLIIGSGFDQVKEKAGMLIMNKMVDEIQEESKTHQDSLSDSEKDREESSNQETADRETIAKFYKEDDLKLNEAKESLSLKPLNYQYSEEPVLEVSKEGKDKQSDRDESISQTSTPPPISKPAPKPIIKLAPPKFSVKKLREVDGVKGKGFRSSIQENKTTESAALNGLSETSASNEDLKPKAKGFKSEGPRTNNQPVIAEASSLNLQAQETKKRSIPKSIKSHTPAEKWKDGKNNVKSKRSRLVTRTLESKEQAPPTEKKQIQETQKKKLEFRKSLSKKKAPANKSWDDQGDRKGRNLDSPSDRPSDRLVVTGKKNIAPSRATGYDNLQAPKVDAEAEPSQEEASKTEKPSAQKGFLKDIDKLVKSEESKLENSVGDEALVIEHTERESTPLDGLAVGRGQSSTKHQKGARGIEKKKKEIEDDHDATRPIDKDTIADSTVTTSEIADGTIALADLDKNYVLATANISTGAVTTTEILDGTIAIADLSTGIVLEAANLAAGEAPSEKIAGTVIGDIETSEKRLRDSSKNPGNNARLGQSNVTAANIVIGSTTVADLSNGAITSSKLDSNLSVSGNLTIGTNLIVTGNMIFGENTLVAVLDEDSLVSDSGTALATQEAIKAYVDNSISSFSTDFSGLTDTDIADLNNGHILVYDGNNSWNGKLLSENITIDRNGQISSSNKIIGTAQLGSIAISAANIGTGAVTSTGILDSTIALEESDNSIELNSSDDVKMITVDISGTIKPSNTKQLSNGNIFISGNLIAADTQLGADDEKYFDHLYVQDITMLSDKSKPGQALVIKEITADTITFGGNAMRQSGNSKATNSPTFTLLPKEVIAKKEAKVKVETKTTPKDKKINQPIVRQFPVNPFVMTSKDRLSTFAMDTDTASYDKARSYIERGFLPPAGIIRMEEFINAFDYHLPAPKQNLFSITSDVVPSPFGKNLWTVRIGIKGKTLGRDQRKPAHLVFAIDSSGSMGGKDRLDLIKDSLPKMIESLGEKDRISLVSYGEKAQLLIENQALNNKAKVIEAIRSLRAQGATYFAEGHELAYEIAARHYRAGWTNRVILLSDGVANVGATKAKDLLERVLRFRKHGIALTCIGFGQTSYNDALLEELANRGDGNYFFIDSAKTAKRILIDNFTSSFQTLAEDAKVQVKFDAEQVRRFRLIGYENRKLKHVEFRNDSVDAGEVNSGQNVVALYEVERITGNQDAPLANVSIRYYNIENKKVEEMNVSLADRNIGHKTVQSHPRLYLAILAAEFAEYLRQSEYQQHSIHDIAKLAEKVAKELPLDDRVQELKKLILDSRGLSR